MKAHICNAAGCFSIVPAANTYCARHQSQQVEKDARIAARAKASQEGRHERSRGNEYRHLMNSARWRKVRAAWIAEHPRCFMCGSVAALQVHHIIAHQGRPEYFYNADNFMTLCHARHVQKTNAEARERRMGTKWD